MPLTFDIAASGFAVRPARTIDAKACRMLVPSMPADAHWLVALDGASGLAIGAAAMALAHRLQPLAGPGVMLHVIELCRRHGVGGALVSALVDLALARRQGAKVLYAAQRAEIDGHEYRGWRSLGFDVCETVEEHEVALADIVARLAPLVEGVRSRGWIPPEARIIPLYAADRDQVLQLHLDELGGDRASLDQRLRGKGPEAFNLRFSRVLLLGERVAGCLLAHSLARGAASIDAVIVKPELRDGWANAWLRLEAIQNAMSEDVTHFKFTTFDHYADTRSFARKSRGVITRRWALMHRPIE